MGNIETMVRWALEVFPTFQSFSPNVSMLFHHGDFFAGRMIHFNSLIYAFKGVLGNKHLKFDIWGKEMETFQSTLEHVMELNKGGIFLTEEARTTERQNSN